MDNETTDFVKTLELKETDSLFRGSLTIILIGYIGITFWLNAIRTTASLWFVWILIGIQFLLYSSIFSFSYSRALVIGFNKQFWFAFFIVLAILGRINNWELFIIPLLLAVMFILSIKNKNLSEKRPELLWVLIFGIIWISFLMLPRLYFFIIAGVGYLVNLFSK